MRDGMTDELPRIGSRLRLARLAKRSTIDEVATACGITKGYLSKLERDHVNASVATLIRVCAELEIPVGSLFDDAPNGDIVRAGDYPQVWFGGEDMTEYLLTPRGERRVQVLLSEVRPGGGSGPESYVLPGDVNFVFVVAGRLRIMFDHQSPDVLLSVGDAFTFSPRQPHSFRSDGPGPTTVLWVLNPALPEGVRGNLPKEGTSQ